MAEGKKSFLLYSDLIHTIEHLTVEQKGNLFDFILQYVNDKNPVIEDQLMKVLFEPIKQQLKRDLIRWEGLKKDRSEAGRKGGFNSGKKRKQNKANEASASKSKQTKQTEANEAVNVNVNVNDSVNVNVNEEEGSARKIPNLNQFLDYAFEIYGKIYSRSGNEIKASATLKYQTWVESNWHTGHGKPILNWKNTLRSTLPHLKREKDTNQPAITASKPIKTIIYE